MLTLDRRRFNVVAREGRITPPPTNDETFYRIQRALAEEDRVYASAGRFLLFPEGRGRLLPALPSQRPLLALGRHHGVRELGGTPRACGRGSHGVPCGDRSRH